MKKETELLWSREKYSIMAKGYAYYKEIQTKLKDAELNHEFIGIQRQIKQYKKLPFDRKAVVNTLEHVWGYFKKSATDSEKQHFFSLLSILKESDSEKLEEIPYEIMLFLRYLLKKYPSDYLSRSTIIK